MSRTTARVEGYASSDVEVRRTQNGKAVASVRVPTQRRKRNEQTQEWEAQGPTTWWEATLWEDDAEALGEIRKGDPLVLEGLPEAEIYQPEGREPSVTVKLIYPTVSRQIKAGRRSAQGGREAAPASAGSWGAPQQPQQPQEQVWGAPAGTYNDETPF